MTNTPRTLESIAGLLNADHKGNGRTAINRIRDVEWLSEHNPAEPGTLFIVESSKTLKSHPLVTTATAVMTIPELAGEFPHAVIIEANQFRIALVQLLQAFKPTVALPDPEGRLVSPTAQIGKDTKLYPGAVVMEAAVIGENCTIMPGVVIESDVRIGDHTVIEANTVIRHHSIIGSHCILHPNTTIGADGFGFHDQDGQRYKLEQIGNVVIGNHVEIGANSTVDRATIESTRIGNYTKLDDHVHIAHNCQIGKYVLIAGCSGVAGSTVVEDRVMMGGMSGLSDHLHFPAGSALAAFSGMWQSPRQPGFFAGTPARPSREMHKINAALKYLPNIIKKSRTSPEAGGDA